MAGIGFGDLASLTDRCFEKQFNLSQDLVMSMNPSFFLGPALGRIASIISKNGRPGRCTQTEPVEHVRIRDD